MPFLGVEDQALRALGCIVVAGGRLEETVRRIAVDLLIPPGRQQITGLLKDIRHRVEDALPAHARVTADEVKAWANESLDAIEERHVPSHSAPAQHKRGPDFVSILVHLRTGSINETDPAALEAIAGRIAATANAGSELDLGLRRSPRRGVFLPNAVYGGQWVPICDTDVGGADLKRPTEWEMDTWWDTYGPFPTLDDKR